MKNQILFVIAISLHTAIFSQQSRYYADPQEKFKEAKEYFQKKQYSLAYPLLKELQQSVSVAVAYFEDTLATPPRQLLSCGLGGPEELIRLLGEESIPVRDLVPMPRMNKDMPGGILAGVVGALAN